MCSGRARLTKILSGPVPENPRRRHRRRLRRLRRRRALLLGSPSKLGGSNTLRRSRLHTQLCRSVSEPLFVHCTVLSVQR